MDHCKLCNNREDLIEHSMRDVEISTSQLEAFGLEDLIKINVFLRFITLIHYFLNTAYFDTLVIHLTYPVVYQHKLGSLESYLSYTLI